MIKTEDLLKLRQDDIAFATRINKIARKTASDRVVYEGLLEQYVPTEVEKGLMNDMEYRDKVFVLAISHIVFELADSPTLTGEEMIDGSIKAFDRYFKTIQKHPEYDYMELVEGWVKFWES